MYFNLKKFSDDVQDYIKKNSLTQTEFAKQLDLKSHTLISLFEQGKRAPSKDTFANFCKITGHKAEDYWETTTNLPFAYLMGNISDSDHDSLSIALKKIDMREYLFALYNRISNE